MRWAAALLAVALAPGAEAATLRVGPGQTYAKPCQAIAAAGAGDVIEVDAAGDYTGDYCSWSTDALTIRGINGRAKIDNRGLSTSVAAQKGIFTIEPPAHSVTIENFELAGAAIQVGSQPGDNNGAAIRHQVEDLTVTNCYLHDNQDGILGSPPTTGTGNVLIQFSEFAHNGAGDGYTHNMYLGPYATVTVQYCYSHEANAGHLLKSRAWTNYVLYNLLADLADGTSSYELDLPQGGLSYVIGNAIEQSQTGADQGNPAIVSYAEENRNNPEQSLYFVANTVVNDANKGTFLQVGGTPTVALIDDVFHGAGSLTSGSPVLLQSHDWTDAQGDPMLVDQAAYDYELQAGSPCIGAGVDPGQTDGGVPLEPTAEYLATASGLTRDDVRWDIGAFEYQDDGGVVDGGFAFGSSGGASGGSTTGGGASGGTSGGSTGQASTGGAATATGGSSGGTAGRGSSGGGTGAAPAGAADGGLGAASGGCNCGAGEGGLSLLALVLVAAVRRRRGR